LLAQASAPLIARFDADDICAPGRLGKQKRFLDSHPRHGLVGSDTRYIDADSQPFAAQDLDRPHDHEAIVANFEAGPNLCHSAVMYRRDLVRTLGGYRASYLHAEDIDLWLRLSEVTQLANLPEPLLAYRVTPEQVSSRHVVTQTTNAAIAWLAHRHRIAGRPDPTGGLPVLPPIDSLDALLGEGAASYVRRRVVDRVLYSPEALSGDGWEILLQHAAENGGDPRLWRAAARLLRAGQPAKAGRVAARLIGLAA
jgi:Glycosyl transferase family 2